MSLDEKFNAAANQIRKFTKRPPDNEMLDVYAIYKQATVGDCSIAKPTDQTAKAKWEAWNAKKGVSQHSAKEKYVAKINALAPKYA